MKHKDYFCVINSLPLVLPLCLSPQKTRESNKINEIQCVNLAVFYQNCVESISVSNTLWLLYQMPLSVCGQLCYYLYKYCLYIDTDNPTLVTRCYC